MQVKGKTIVVTGAGSGLGQAMTLQLLEKEARIALVDIDEKGLSETVQLAGAKSDRLSVHVMSIAEPEHVKALPDKVLAAHGAVDGLINNAGIIQPFIPVNDLEMSMIERVMNINFYGCLYMTKAFLPLLLERPEAHILNVSSLGGFMPFPGQSIYGASKAAMKLMTEGLYAELRETSVRVTVVHPGAMKTHIMRNSGMEEPDLESDNMQTKLMLSAEDAAAKVIRAMEKNKFRATVGKDAGLLDILYRINPRRAVNFIQKQMADRIPGN